jgi:hypothetical protein
MPTIVNDPDVGLDFTRVLHGSQSYELRRPLVEGERLTARASIGSIRRKGDSSFLTLVVDLIGDDGELAVRAQSTLIERGPS